MDSNVKALLHVQSALLAALCATHPQPERLSSAFSFHLGQVENVLEQIPQMKTLVNAWAKTFRQHIPATVEPSPPE